MKQVRSLLFKYKKTIIFFKLELTVSGLYELAL